jgi:hypothetical protein
MPSGLQTNGAGCAVVVNDFVYLFANGIVRRFLLKGLGQGLTGDGTRIWENLGTMPFNSVYSGESCSPLPSNRNQILIEVVPSAGTSPNSIIYDITTNAFTTVASTTATIDFSGGTPLNELCHGDFTLYAFPYGARAKSYFATGATEAAIWPDVATTMPLAAPRYNPTVAIVPETLLAFAPFTNCAGC